jgi:hypothetical protein
VSRRAVVRVLQGTPTWALSCRAAGSRHHERSPVLRVSASEPCRAFAARIVPSGAGPHCKEYARHQKQCPDLRSRPQVATPVVCNASPRDADPSTRPRPLSVRSRGTTRPRLFQAPSTHDPHSQSHDRGALSCARATARSTTRRALKRGRCPAQGWDALRIRGIMRRTRGPTLSEARCLHARVGRRFCETFRLAVEYVLQGPDRNTRCLDCVGQASRVA